MHVCAALLIACAVTSATPADAACRQALVLGLDVSGSVDASEYAMQRDGLAAALLHPDVAAAILQMPQSPVWLAVYEWSGPAGHVVILPWAALIDRAALVAAAARIAAAQRSLPNRETGLGSAMLTGGALLARRPDCGKRTLDLSGDGPSNAGPRPREVTRAPVLGDVTVNALVIGGDGAQALARLTAYFRAEVLHGPDAFVEQADGFADFETAMVRKLLRELQGLSVAALVPDQ